MSSYDQREELIVDLRVIIAELNEQNAELERCKERLDFMIKNNFLASKAHDAWDAWAVFNRHGRAVSDWFASPYEAIDAIMNKENK
jgi:hypothetical protein